ncbi:MAG: hypothetical protein JSV33_04010 [bacterium]|nr:MAG: hypothetical protein JSV33_04010 [bacterium]
MRMVIAYCACCILCASCASRHANLTPRPCDHTLPALFSMTGASSGVVIVAKTRIDLPRYRLRGICQIRYLPPDNLRIDFEHSSLFGTYREDTSIFIHGRHMEIYDRERGHFFETDSSRALISEGVGFSLFPDDLIIALALREPPCDEIEGADLREGNGEWSLTGGWRTRRIAISGKRDVGPSVFRMCVEGSRDCYVVRYSYSDDRDDFRYPSRITLTHENHLKRISMVIRKVEREPLDPSVFRWNG